MPGGYAVNIFTLGVPNTIIIDDYMPFFDGKPMAAKLADDGSVWPMVLEKALAKLRGNYLHISGGDNAQGVRYMRGGPSTHVSTIFKTPEQIWDFIAEHLSNGDAVTASSMSGDDSYTDDWGIVMGHAYTIAGIKTLSDGTKLIRARNPWGKDEYKGDFGCDSEKWTDKLVNEVPDAKNHEDGYIYVPIQQFKVSFRAINVNYNTKRMFMDYYLKFDDEPKMKVTEQSKEVLKKMAKDCGEGCIIHKIHVVSTVAQKVWFSISTYSESTMPESCTEDAVRLWHTIYPNPYG